MHRGERLLVAVPFAAYAAEWVDGPSKALVFVAVALVGGWSWFGVLAAAVLACGFAAAPLAVPNHHVVALWLAVSLALRGDDPVANRALYGALMVAAALQKLLSPDFMDGSLFAYLGITGGFFRPVFAQSDAWTALFDANQALVAGAGLEPVTLRGPLWLPLAGVVAAWTVVLVEGALAVLAMVGGRGFVGCAAVFVVLLPLVRDEPVFASLLTVVTALCVPSGKARWVLLGWGLLCATGSLLAR